MKAIKTIKFKSLDEFQLQIVNFDQEEWKKEIKKSVYVMLKLKKKKTFLDFTQIKKTGLQH